MPEGQDVGDKSTEERPGDNSGHELQDQLEDTMSCCKQEDELKELDLDKVCEISALALHDRGKHYLDIGKFTEARDSLQKALTHREELLAESGWGYSAMVNAAKTRNLLGQLCEAQGNFDEAREVRRNDRSMMELCGNDSVSLIVFLSMDLGINLADHSP